jgi:hypothetical protein
MTTPDRSQLPPRTELCGSLVDARSVSADPYGLATVTLVRRDELDTAVAVQLVVPFDKYSNPLTGLVIGDKWLAGGCRALLH